MADVLTIDIAHRFASGVEVRASIERAIGGGSILVLFGPSGAGKTSILRSVAGLLRPDEGRIAFRGAIWFDSRAERWVPPQGRRVGYVPQTSTLFPHLTVRENVAYGLRLLDADARRRRIAEVLSLLQLDDLAARYPRHLSGGQAQRVALARALAPSPGLLLLDEPFAGLDASTRRPLRAEMRSVIRDLGAAAILVTHDRMEAMAMADDFAIVIDGRVRQGGAAADVFARPADRVVAQSLGIETIVSATVEERTDGLVRLRIGDRMLTAVAGELVEPGDCGAEVFACIRAEDVVVEERESGGTSVRNHLAGSIVAIESEGAVDRVTVDCGFRLVALVTHRSCQEMHLTAGSRVTASIKATAVSVVAKAR